MKIRPGIYCRGSCVHVLARNVTGKCATEVNGLPRGLVRVCYTRTGTNMPMCELHNSRQQCSDTSGATTITTLCSLSGEVV